MLHAGKQIWVIVETRFIKHKNFSQSYNRFTEEIIIGKQEN